MSMHDQNVIDIDGSVLEGGGQILRMAIVFSGLLKKPVRIFNIRANRSKPGLAAQHLNGLLVARDICQGRVENAHIGSSEVIFYPGSIHQGSFSANTKTAGSVTLIMQVAVPLLLFGSGQSTLNVKGGTNADMAPPLDFYLHLWKPVFSHFFNLNVNIRDVKRGFFPKGGGEVHVEVSPVQYIHPIVLTDRGQVTSLWGHSFVAGAVRPAIARTMADSAYEELVKHHPNLKGKINIHTEQLPFEKAFGNGSGIYLFAETSTKARFSGGMNGSPKVSPSENGQKAAQELSEALKNNGCTDTYTQDQLIVMMALGKGKSCVKTGVLSLHTKTAIYIAELLTSAKFHVTEGSDGTSTIECDGMGLTNKNYCR